MDVLPAKQDEVLLQYTLDLVCGEAPPDGSPMLVEDPAAGFIEDLPSPFPGLIAQVGVFQVKRRKQGIEPSELEELAPVKRRGASTPVETRKQPADLLIDAVPHPQ